MKLLVEDAKVSLRMPATLLANLDVLAARKHMPRSELVRRVLHKYVQLSQEAAGGASADKGGSQ